MTSSTHTTDDESYLQSDADSYIRTDDEESSNTDWEESMKRWVNRQVNDREVSLQRGQRSNLYINMQGLCNLLPKRDLWGLLVMGTFISRWTAEWALSSYTSILI